jgi:hypothetical protein
MKTFKILFLLLTALIISFLTGCYTQVATTDPEPYKTTTIYKQTTESDNYYSEDGEILDSSYYSEIDPEYEESVTIINEYYNNYPSGYYDYYPYFSIGIGFSWGWGWGGYYSYYPYYPYYSGWWGCGYPTPYYGCYSGYYYYDPYYCYGGYYPYYGYDYGYGYGYNSRNDYVTRIRNNSGGRNSGGRNYSGQQRDPMVTSTNGSIDRSRDDINLGRDLTVGRINTSDRSTDIQNRTGDVTREVVGLKDNERISNTKRNDVASNEISRTTDARKDKKLGLDREVTTNKSLGISTRNNDSRKNVQSSNNGNVSDRINNNNRIGNETKKIFEKDNTSRQNTKQNVRTNNDTKQPNVRSNSKSNQTPKKNTNTRTYTPPKQNNNSPRTNSQPRNNNNTPRSYSPPSSNNSPRSYSPPSGNSGSHNSGSRNSGSNNSGSRKR